jgi:hypothetical protein
MRRNLMAGFVAGALFLAACSSGVLELEVGTCFDDPGDSFDEVSEVPVVDCNTPHDNEVFANQDLTGSEYPGREQVQNRADAICLENFSSYVGIAYEDSIYDIGSLYPSEDTWNVGDREVICFAYDLSLEKITGSINGVAQ